MSTQNSLAVYMDRIHPTSELIAKEFGIKKMLCYKRAKFLHPFLTALEAPLLANSARGYDVYLLESLAPAPLLPFIKNPHSKVIVIGNSHEPFLMERSPIRRVFFTKLLNVDKYVDHLIAVSKMIKEDFEKYFNFDIKVAELFMHRDYNRLSKLPVDFDSKNFVFIGGNPFLKGVDIMIDVFIGLKKKGIIKAETKFYILTNRRWLEKRGYEDSTLQKYKIFIIPPTQNIEEYLKKSLFQFHLARYEPNAVAIMEGMASGHIPIVSYRTGNRDFISQIDNNLIINSFDIKTIQKQVEDILNLSDEELRRLSLRFRKMSAYYSTDVGLQRWRRVWREIT